MSDIYCEGIIPGSLAVDVVHETEMVLAFHHTDPFFETHIVIIPKEHIESISDEIPDQLKLELLEAIRIVAKLFGEKTGGCRVSTNVGDYQTSKHLHFYVHSGNHLRS